MYYLALPEVCRLQTQHMHISNSQEDGPSHSPALAATLHPGSLARARSSSGSCGVSQLALTGKAPGGEVFGSGLAGVLDDVLGHGPQHCLHHGQVLQVLMRLEQRIACMTRPSCCIVGCGRPQDAELALADHHGQMLDFACVSGTAH